MNRRAPWLALAIALIAGCGNDEESVKIDDAGADAGDDGGTGVTKAEGRAVLTDRAIVLDDEALDALGDLSPQGDQTELSFSDPPDTLEDLEAGDVLIFGVTDLTPNGALLEVEEVERDGSELTVLAHRAEIGAAFEELEIEFEAQLSLDEEPSSSSNPLTEGVAVSEQPLGIALPFTFTGDDGDSELNVSVAIDADIGFNLDFSFEDGLSELSIRLDTSETFSAELLAAGATGFEEEVELDTVFWPPVTILIPVPGATVPVTLTPQVVFEAGVRGSVQGATEASVLQEAAFSAGLGYIDGEFGDFSDSDGDFQFDPPTYEASANLKAWAGPRAEILIYGAVGPFISASAFVELAAQVDGPPPCVTGTLSAGLEINAGVEVIAEYETNVLYESEPLASFDSCNPDADPDAPRPAMTWSRTYGREGSPGEVARAVIEAADGSYVVVGHSDLYGPITGFAASTWVLRLDALGQVIWQRAFSREALGLIRGVVEVPEGFLVAGDQGVMKIDNGGNPVWAKSYVEDTPVIIASIAAQADGRFVVAGYTGPSARAWAMGLDEEGEVLWSSNFIGEDIGRVRATADGGYVLVGKVSDAFDISVLKLDEDGEVQWARIVDNLFDPNPDEGDVINTSDDRAFDIAEKPDGGFVIAGEAYGNFPLPEPQPVGFYATWIVELEDNGDLISSTTHRAPTDALYGGAYAVAVRPDGTSIVAGRRADESSDLLSTEDILIVQGIGYTVLGGAGYDSLDGGTLTGVGRGMPLAITRDGGAILAATSDSFSGQPEIWLLKLNRTGGINIPERSSVSGMSFVNGIAESNPFQTSGEDVGVSARTFTSEIDWEVTGVVTSLTR